MTRFLKDRRAAELLEFAVTAPLVLAILLGLFQVGMVAYASQMAKEASRHGARTGSVAQDLPAERAYAAAANHASSSFPLGHPEVFILAPGGVTVAKAHRTVEEIWYFLTGRGEMWHKLGDQEKVVEVYPGICITIPAGTHFQFRSFGYEPLAALGVTMPPWPGEGESYRVAGPWEPTVEAGRD